MNNDLISRSALIKWIDDSVSQYGHTYSTDMLNMWGLFKDYLINNAPTVDTEELKPLVDKVVEILPELTDAIIKELPKMVSGKIKCSECSYYTNTFNGEWVRKEDLIHYIATQYIEHNELVPIWLRLGDMKGGTE